MKKKDIVDLIKAHYSNNDNEFRAISNRIASEFSAMGDTELAAYITAQMTSVDTVVPQSVKYDTKYLTEVKLDNSSLPLPPAIAEDLKGIINAIHHRVGIGRFLFEGAPGTGKTESAKQIARLLNRVLLAVDFNKVIDSKLGQTAKNIASVFTEINHMPNLSRVIILFDEIDSLALDRLDDRDVREMGRATSSVLKELDNVNPEAVIIATTNLYGRLDRAFRRRFDAVINFDRYTRKDLIDAAETILNEDLSKFPEAGRDIKLFRKILQTSEEIPNPGELKNIIKVSLAFSDPQNPYDYLGRFYKDLHDTQNLELTELRSEGFTIREISILTNIPKSTVSRELQG
ncbi:MAG: AAA family ATPase [Limosilactobacillus sp.]